MPIDNTDFADETQALSAPGRDETRPFHRTHRGQITMISAAILALGVIVGGYLLGDGLRRSREADRAVTVRGVAEKEVDRRSCHLDDPPIRRRRPILPARRPASIATAKISAISSAASALRPMRCSRRA